MTWQVCNLNLKLLATPMCYLHTEVLSLAVLLFHKVIEFVKTYEWFACHTSTLYLHNKFKPCMLVAVSRLPILMKGFCH